MLFVGKRKKKTFAPTVIIPDKNSLSMKARRADFGTHLMINCFESNFVPLNPLEYGWEEKDDGWSPLWFDGTPLQSLDDVEEGDEHLEDEKVGEGSEDDSSEAEYSFSDEDL